MSKCNDEDLKRKRNANLNSVRVHRENKKKLPVEELIKTAENMKDECLQLENFLEKNFQGFKFEKLEDKLNKIAF
jgi:hypothetical protein